MTSASINPEKEAELAVSYRNAILAAEGEERIRNWTSAANARRVAAECAPTHGEAARQRQLAAALDARWVTETRAKLGMPPKAAPPAEDHCAWCLHLIDQEHNDDGSCKLGCHTASGR